MAGVQRSIYQTVQHDSATNAETFRVDDDGAVTTSASITAATGMTATTGGFTADAGDITATTGDLVATAGAVTADGNITTANGDITATTGDLVATAGAVDAATTVTAGTGVTATTGNIAASAGAVSASTTVTAGTGITATTGDIAASNGGYTASSTTAVGAIAADGTLVNEESFGPFHRTTLTFTDTITVGAAALAGGAACYTFPAVRTLIMGLSIDGTITSVGAGGAVGDTPDVGVGILAGTGANATLNLVGATAENIITGAASGAVAVAPGVDHDSNTLVGLGNGIVLAASQTVWANFADTWSGADDVTYAGTMIIVWAALD
jgi:hypothetical protein